MATARPPSGGTPNFRIGVDFSVLREAPNAARGYAQATAREISQAFRVVQSEQRLMLEQARQTTTVLRAQQTQITATTRAESQQRTQQARAEAQAQQQAARLATATGIEEQRRLTAQFKSELRERERANRQSQAQQSGFGRGLATFAGAAFAGPVGGLVGAVAGGSPALAAGLAVSEGARFAVEASQTAMAYNRQRVAAVNLAGSQRELNELMVAYQRASGGAVDRATALANVTRLQAVGFADNAEEVEVFTRAVRGSSIAMGKLQDEISQEVQLAISNQSLRRLDQIGLGITEVNDRIAQLRASNQGMTREAAFQEAVLGLLNEKFGALADSAEGQATGTERLTAAWRDMRLEVGQDITVNVNQATGALAELLEWLNRVRVARRQMLEEMNRSGEAQAREILAERGQFIGPSFTDPVPRWMTSATPFAGPPGRTPLDTDQVAALRRRDEGFAAIERQSTLARLQENRSYETQRSRTIANFEQARAEEAQDFARQRANQERRLAMSILDIHQDAARQRTRWEAETERNINEARAERDERIAEAREDSNERIAEIEEKFNRDREKRQRAFAERLRDAAANLDAVEVRDLQRQQREENEEAERTRDEAIADERESLQERIDEANKAFAKQEEDQRAALQRRIDLQAEDDALRIAEMQANWEEQKAQEDIERGIRLERQAAHHQAQLDQMDTEHGDRIQQIKDQAQAERDQFTEESNAFLEEVGIHNQKWLDEQERINNGVINRHFELLEAQRRSLLTPGHPSLADPYVDRAAPAGSFLAPVLTPSSSVSSSRSNTINVHPGAIVIQEAVRAGQTKEEVWQALLEFMEDM